jgi:hypothetical protein
MKKKRTEKREERDGDLPVFNIKFELKKNDFRGRRRRRR